MVTDHRQGQENDSIILDPSLLFFDLSEETSTLCGNTLMFSFSLQWKVTPTYLPPREMFAFDPLLFTKYFESHAWKMVGKR